MTFTNTHELLDFLDNHTCIECDGHGELQATFAPDDYEYYKCPECDNGFSTLLLN